MSEHICTRYRKFRVKCTCLSSPIAGQVRTQAQISATTSPASEDAGYAYDMRLSRVHAVGEILVQAQVRLDGWFTLHSDQLLSSIACCPFDNDADVLK